MLLDKSTCLHVDHHQSDPIWQSMPLSCYQPFNGFLLPPEVNVKPADQENHWAYGWDIFIFFKCPGLFEWVSNGVTGKVNILNGLITAYLSSHYPYNYPPGMNTPAIPEHTMLDGNSCLHWCWPLSPECSFYLWPTSTGPSNFNWGVTSSRSFS